MDNTKNRFTGEHSKVMINLDHVICATSEGYSRSDVHVVMRDDKELLLKGEDASLFMRMWRGE